MSLSIPFIKVTIKNFRKQIIYYDSLCIAVINFSITDYYRKIIINYNFEAGFDDGHSDCDLQVICNE